MGKGNERVRRIIVATVDGHQRYGCTVTQLAYAIYGDSVNSDSHVDAVERAVHELVAQGRVVERVMFGTDRYIVPATLPAPRARARPTAAPANRAVRQWLRCDACDVQWVSEAGAAHRRCWSCGAAGQP